MRDEKLEALKTTIVAERSSKRGPFSPELCQRLIEHVAGARARGQSVETISRELGLCSKTMYGWLSRAKLSQLRRVQVVGEEPTQPCGSLSMRGPAGTCVEGLSLDDVVAIWRKLGC